MLNSNHLNVQSLLFWLRIAQLCIRCWFGICVSSVYACIYFLFHRQISFVNTIGWIDRLAARLINWKVFHENMNDNIYFSTRLSNRNQIRKKRRITRECLAHYANQMDACSNGSAMTMTMVRVDFCFHLLLWLCRLPEWFWILMQTNAHCTGENDYYYYFIRVVEFVLFSVQLNGLYERCSVFNGFCELCSLLYDDPRCQCDHDH